MTTNTVKHTPDAREWQEHKGGDRPVAGDVVVEVRFADGTVASLGDEARFWAWDHFRPFEDRIVAYRLAAPQEKGRAG